MDSRHAATVSIKTSAVLWDWWCNKKDFTVYIYLNIFASLWSTTALSTSVLESQIKYPVHETQCFAGRQLQLPLTV
jgi:hypothetical protein